jgi:RNase adaptor protein for sRNA GlmZ degradation
MRWRRWRFLTAGGRSGAAARQVTIAVGCVGGRHRSAGIAIEAARYLESAGVPVTVTHRDMGRPVIARAAGGAR